MQIRLAIEANLEAIVEIYNAAIPSRMSTADLKPITVESRRDWFHAHSDRYPVWVITSDEKIIGWQSLQRFYGRAAYHKTAEVSIYIAPAYQGKGIGKELLNHAIATSPHRNITKLVGFVFAHNTASCNLFKSFGFEQWGFLPEVAELDSIEQSLLILGKIIHPKLENAK